MKHAIAIIGAAVLITGCALGTKPLDVQPAYVPTSEYSAMTCDELPAAHAAAVKDKQHWVEKQQELRTGNIVMAALVLGFGTGDGPETKELAKAKGRLQAINETMKRKGCKHGNGQRS